MLSIAHDHAAVHVQHLSSDVGGRIRRKENRCTHQILRLSDPPQGDAPAVPGFGFLGRAAVHRRVDDAGSHDVDSHVMRRGLIGNVRKRYLYVAMDRCSRFVHLAVYDAETAANAVAFLTEARKAFPFRITHVLTDRGSCFTADDFERACARLKLTRRTTRPYTPQTNGMVERLNGRVASEVLGITVSSHDDLELLLTGFNHAYNHRRQRVLSGVSPIDTVRQRFEHNSRKANPCYKPANSNDIMPKVEEILHYANDVSQPDS